MKKVIIILGLLLSACVSNQQSIENLPIGWEFKEILVDMEEDPKRPWLQDFLYEFEIPLPKDAVMEFPQWTNVMVSSGPITESDNPDYFAFKIGQNKDDMQGFINDFCSTRSSSEIEKNAKIIKQDKKFIFYEILPKCNGNQGFIIKSKNSIYYLTLLKQWGNFEKFEFAVMNLRKNSRAIEQ
jgi:hypothetical protein